MPFLVYFLKLGTLYSKKKTTHASKKVSADYMTSLYKNKNHNDSPYLRGGTWIHEPSNPSLLRFPASTNWRTRSKKIGNAA